MSARRSLEALLLALLDPERIDLVDREVEPFAVAIGLVERRAARRRARRASVDSALHAARHAAAVDAAEAVEQGAMALGVEQAAIVMLAVDFDQPRAGLAQRARGHRHAAGEGAAAAVGLERAAQEQRLARLGLDALLGEQHDAVMVVADLERGRDHRLRLPGADQGAVGARAKRQPERVEQDRLARPGLAGEHAKPGFEIEVERLDQDDIADGKLPKHRAAFEPSPAARCAGSACSCAHTICCPDNCAPSTAAALRASPGMPRLR